MDIILMIEERRGAKKSALNGEHYIKAISKCGLCIGEKVQAKAKKKKKKMLR